MDDFRSIYTILKHLRETMDYEDPDMTPIQPEQLRITPERWEKLMIMLEKNGCVEGLQMYQTLSASQPRLVLPARPQITLKGLEYLAENSFMKKAANLAKGIIEVAT